MDWIGLYLDEDIGAGDITSEPLFSAQHQGSATLILHKPGVVAGLARCQEVFERLSVRAERHIEEGTRVAAGTRLMSVSGPTRGILAAERLALNIVGRMSGIATMTRDLGEQLAVACCPAQVVGTRKTTPGFRQFEKEAIVIAGGQPHRMGLYDAMMIKDNHREAVGDTGEATRILRAAHPERTLFVEVESQPDAMLAAANGADIILIDNQSPETGRAWAESVWHEFPAVKIEASGGITSANVVAYGWADRISLGALTHQAQSLDVGLDWLKHGASAPPTPPAPEAHDAGRAPQAASGAPRAKPT